jgi:hypothetical protein
VFFIGIVVALAAVASVAKLSLINLPHDFYPTHAPPDQANSAAMTRACLSEYTALQAGLFGYMRANDLSTVPVPVEPTNDMNAPVPLFSSGYARTSRTTIGYVWRANGAIDGMSAMGGRSGMTMDCYPGAGWPVTIFAPSPTPPSALPAGS